MDDEVVALSMRGLLSHIFSLDRLHGKFLRDLLQLAFVVYIGVLQGRLRIVEHRVQVDLLWRIRW